MKLSKFFPTMLAAMLLAMPAVYADDAEPAPDQADDNGMVNESTDAPADDSDAAVNQDESGSAEQPTTDTAEPESTAAEIPPVVEEVDPGIKQLQDYYAKVYGKPLTQKSRLAKLVAVMSLSKIDAPQLTNELLKVTADKDNILSQLAWEAVLARSESLTPKQRQQWAKDGITAANSGAFPGTTLAPVLEAAAQFPLNERDTNTIRNLFERLCKESNPETAEGKAALAAGGRALAAWNDPQLTKGVYFATMTKSKLFDRAVIMFSQFPNSPKNGGQKEWKEWQSKTRFVPTMSDQLKPFNGTSLFFPKPEKILDANDPKWTKDAELPELSVSALRTVICLDATGSGADLNEFVTSFVENLASCIDVVADKNQMGVIYYRHEIDPKVMADCCRTLRVDDDDFRVLPVPLTSDIPALVANMKSVYLNRQKGHDHGKAAYVGGLQAAKEMLGGARRDTISVIALFGDAPGTEGKEDYIPKVTKQIVDDNIDVYFMVRDGRADNALAEAIKVSGNDSIFYKSSVQLLQDTPDKSSIEIFDDSAFGTLSRRILGSALPPAYSDRADKIVTATTKVLRARDRAAKARALLEDRPAPAKQ